MFIAAALLRIHVALGDFVSLSSRPCHRLLPPGSSRWWHPGEGAWGERDGKNTNLFLFAFCWWWLLISKECGTFFQTWCCNKKLPHGAGTEIGLMLLPQAMWSLTWNAGTSHRFAHERKHLQYSLWNDLYKANQVLENSSSNGASNVWTWNCHCSCTCIVADQRCVFFDELHVNYWQRITVTRYFPRCRIVNSNFQVLCSAGACGKNVNCQWIRWRADWIFDDKCCKVWRQHPPHNNWIATLVATATVLRGIMDDRTSTACCHCRLFLQAPLAMAQLTKIRRKRSEPCRSHTFYERIRILPISPRVTKSQNNRFKQKEITHSNKYKHLGENLGQSTGNFTSTTFVGNPGNPLLQTTVLYVHNTCWCLQKKAHLLYLVHILSCYTFLYVKTEMNRLIATWLHSNIVRCTRSRNWLHSCRCQFPHFLQAHPVAITHGATQRLFHKHQGRQ